MVVVVDSIAVTMALVSVQAEDVDEPDERRDAHAAAEYRMHRDVCSADAAEDAVLGAGASDSTNGSMLQKRETADSKG